MKTAVHAKLASAFDVPEEACVPPHRPDTLTLALVIGPASAAVQHNPTRNIIERRSFKTEPAKGFIAPSRNRLELSPNLLSQVILGAILFT
jgi:hypothetical protein